jgi:hypothetical protein
MRRDREEIGAPWAVPVCTLFVATSLLTAAQRPSKDGYRTHVALFVPRDRRPTPNHEAKISVVMELVSELYQSDLKAKGYQTPGLRYETNWHPSLP